MENEVVSKIKFEKQFIESLLDKLKVGNRRGIHLNAIPGNARSRLDLKALDRIHDSMPASFLEEILTKEAFEYDINFDGINLTELDEDEKNRLHLVARKLNNISIDNEDQYLESGIRNFGFGYPLLVRRDATDPTKVIKAPLLIWNLDINRSNRKSNSWTISKTVDHPVRINELFRSHVLKDAQVAVDSLSEKYLKDNLIDHSELIEICQNILSQLNIQPNDSVVTDLRVEKCPTGKKIDELATDNAWILWSGIFGLYTARKESVIRQAEEILKRLKEFKDEKLVLDKFQTSTISAVPTDPSKEEIVNSLTASEVKLIQGPPGTGKSQALTAIITNTISSGGRCLVVCEKRTALNVIQHNLEKNNLGELGVIIDDVSKDRTRVVKKARGIVDGVISNAYYGNRNLQNAFDNKYEEFLRLKDEFNSKHHNERGSKVGPDAWKDSIGKFLQFTSEIEWPKVKSFMPAHDQDLAEDDYLLLEDIVNDASISFGHIDKRADDLFSSIDQSFFEKSYSKRIADGILEAMKRSLEELEKIVEIFSNTNEKDFIHNRASIFGVDHVTKQKKESEANLEAAELYKTEINNLYSHLRSFEGGALNFKSFGDKIENRNFDEINVVIAGNELRDLLDFSEKNIKLYRLMLDAYKSVFKVNLQFGVNHEPDLPKDFLAFLAQSKIDQLFKNEQKRKKVLTGLISDMDGLVSVSDEEETLRMGLVENVKDVFRGKKSRNKYKRSIKNVLRDNCSFVSSIKIYDDYNLEELFRLTKRSKKICNDIKSDIKSYKNIENWFKKLTEFEKSFSKNYLQVFSENPLALNKFNEISSYGEMLRKEMGKLQERIDLFSQYKNVHNWTYFYNSLDSNKQELITRLVESEIDTTRWLTALRAWRYYNLLSDLEEKSSGFHTNDELLERLTTLYKELKKDQVRVIKQNWSRNLSNEDLGSFKLLYNLRKNRAHNRTNSLRKIIDKDFGLFTSIFPVILTNPLAADAILPLQLGIFDVVIFDEASQLKIEDTFTSFIRGKYKIIAGDAHQMPPSNYFQAAGEVGQSEDMTNEELENTEMALSESLLEFAEKLGYQSQSYLDYHYRSQHPALIDFSNSAFYGGNLVPFPERFAYNPIAFYEVNGTFIDRVNQEEVEKVIDILKMEIQPKPDGSYPSVGIATFNLPQRNQIIERVNQEILNDPEFAVKIDQIRESENGLFIKNLENIQGDEMDVVIISTTYGKDSNGKFYERFGPLNLEKGYKLLNVLVTRARDKIYICCSVPQSKYGAYYQLLEQYGNNKKAIFYSYLSYAKAISGNDHGSADNVKEKLIEHSHDQSRSEDVSTGLTESPFEEEVYECLLEKMPSEKIIPQKRIGGFRVDFLIDINGKKVVLECDGKAYHSTNEAYAHDVYRQKELEALGYSVYRIWSTSWWHDHAKEINKLLKYLDAIAGVDEKA